MKKFSSTTSISRSCSVIRLLKVGFYYLLIWEYLSLVFGACPDNCSEHGTCNDVSNKCTCDDGYTGLDCSIQATECPGGNKVCYNGAECVKVIDAGENVIDAYGNIQYDCDCSVQFAKSIIDGITCQRDPRTIMYCTTTNINGTTTMNNDDNYINKQKIPISFCVNGGSCTEIIENGEEHPGCDCLENYSGDYCQYLYGHDPDSLKNKGLGGSISSLLNSDTISVGGHPLSPIIIIITGVAFIVVVIIIIFVIHRRYHYMEYQKSAEINGELSDLYMDRASSKDEDDDDEIEDLEKIGDGPEIEIL